MIRRSPFTALVLAFLVVASVLPPAVHPESDATAAVEEKRAEAAEADAGGDSSSSDAGNVDRWEDYTGDERVSVGSDVDVPAGTVHHGNVVCIGGNATVAGEVVGDIVVIGGTLDLSGVARGEVVCVGSTITLHDTARIDDQFVNVLGSLDNRGAEIRGQRVDIPFAFNMPGMKSPLGVIGAIIWWATVVSLVLFFIGLLFFAALVPDRIRILSDETPLSLLWAFLAGLAAYVVVTILEFLLLVSVIGIPILIFVRLAFIVLKWLGMAGMLHYLGKRFGKLANRDLSLLGALLLGFVPVALIRLLPFLVGGFTGLILYALARCVILVFLEAPAVGLILLTRAGGRPRKPATVAAPPTHAMATLPAQPPPAGSAATP